MRFPKKGNHSIDVAMQYSGTLGKVGYCQIGVQHAPGYSSGKLTLGLGVVPPGGVGRGPRRCQKAGIPWEVTNRAKWQLALDLTDRVLSWKLQPQIVVADAAYGSVAEYRDGLGLDHFEGRKWSGWHRHVTLTTLTFAFLLLERLRGQKGCFR